METVLLWAGIIVGVLAGLFLMLFLVGSLMPRRHQVRRSLTLAQAPETIWNTITDFPDAGSWRMEIQKVERLGDRNGHEVWRETYKGNFGMALETTTAVAPRRLVRTIADEKGPFAGCWEYDLTLVGSGCCLTITEHGEIANPFIRLLARFLMDPAKHLEMYLAALATKFGEQPVIQKAA